MGMRKNLKEARQRAGMTQQQMAELQEETETWSTQRKQDA